MTPFVRPCCSCQVQDVQVAAHPQFPKDVSGLAWYGCPDSLKQYPQSANESTPLPTKDQKDLRRAYYASVSYMDYNFGLLMSHVKQLGLRDDTVIVMHSDHGYQLGERNIWCKETVFDLATRVPLMIHAPQYAQVARARTDAMVELVDLFPTLVELAGLPSVDTPHRNEIPLEGRSIVPVIAAVSTGSHVAQTVELFNASFSQYSRRRCRSNLFCHVQTCCPESSSTPRSKASSDTGFGTWTGFSVRTRGYRYSRWVAVDGDGWAKDWKGDIDSEEFYVENGAGGPDNYATCEPANLVKSAGVHQAALDSLRELLWTVTGCMATNPKMRTRVCPFRGPMGVAAMSAAVTPSSS